MGAIRLRLGAELRARWRGWLGLALLLAAFAGLTLATAAGARRTDTAYQRLLKISHPFDQFLLGVGPHPVSLFPLNKPMTLEQVRSLPEVADDLTEYFFDGPNGAPGGIASPDTRMDRSFNTARIVAGRLPESATEVAVPVAIVSTYHARVGRTITVRLVDQSTNTPRIVPTEFTVTGIIAVPGEFPPYSDLGPPRLHFSAAFYNKYQSFGGFPYTFVRLKRGAADMPAFLKSLGAISHGLPVIGYRQEDLARNVERSFHLQAVALELFALFLAIVAALVLGQTLGRQAMAEGVDYPALRALGMTRRQLFGLGVIRASILSVAGIALAIPIAIALSPLAPTGLARAADPNPGVHFDLVALAGGAAIALVVLMLLVLIPCARAARLAERDEVFGRAESGAERASRSVEAVTRAGASAPAVVGMRLALEPGRGRTAVPVRTTIAGVVLAIAALTITLSFGASLRYLLDTPRLYGQTWDEGVGWDNVSPQQFAQAIAAARADPNVEKAAPVSAGVPFLVDGVPADGMVVPPEAETFLPPIESGRGPRAADEIALGPKTLRRINKNVGDEVSVSVVGVPAKSFRVVGRLVVPTVGHTANLGEGSVVTNGGIEQFFPGSDAPDEFVVRFKPGVNETKARAQLEKDVAPAGASTQDPTTPGDLLNFGRSRNLPLILSGLLVLLGLGTLAHALVTSINRRRRDFAICKTLGFTRRDVARAIAWQSSTFIVVSLVFGLVIGVIAGRALWSVYANQLGILNVPRIPLVTLLLIIPSAALLANGLALLPARSAAGTRPAIVLRAE